MVLKELKEYIINFVGLKLGLHDFEYLITSSFFEEMQSEEPINVNLKLHLELEKQVNLLILNLDFSGSFETICDRCADSLVIPLEFKEKIFVNITDSESGEDDDNVIYLTTGESQIDISHLVYEFIMLALPMKRVHLDDDEGNSLCNQETLKLLNESKPSISDPRWDILNKLKIEN